MQASVPRAGAYRGFQTIREIVQRQLTDDIQSGRIQPGDKLREAELAERYGVSRGPVREAVRALEGQGLVSVRPNHGAVVTVLSGEELEEMYDILVDLERLALSRIDLPLSAASLAPLERVHELMERTADPETWLAYNDDFHFALLRLSGRQRLCRLVAELHGSLRSYARVYAQQAGRLGEANTEHRLMLDAAAAGDRKALRNVSREHRLRAKSVIAGAMGAAQASAPRAELGVGEPAVPARDPKRQTVVVAR